MNALKLSFSRKITSIGISVSHARVKGKKVIGFFVLFLENLAIDDVSQVILFTLSRIEPFDAHWDFSIFFFRNYNYLSLANSVLKFFGCFSCIHVYKV